MGLANPTSVIAPLAVLAPLTGLALGLGGVAPSAAVAAPSFTLVGFAPGTAGSRLFGLSADGRSAAGYSQEPTSGNTRFPGFRWNATTGRNDFGLSLAPALTVGFGISGDGNTVVGLSKPAETSGASTAFRWTQSGGYQSLGVLPGFDVSEALDANHDGSVIVGTLQNAGGGSSAFRWTQAGGMQALGGGTRVDAVSGAGGTVVGNYSGSGSYMWTLANGLQPLAGLEGTLNTTARAVNNDGSIIVGTSISPTFVSRTTMWVNGAPTELTNNVPNTRFTPFGVSDDGSVVAGVLGGSGSGLHRTAVWTAATGAIPLTQYLTANGVVLPAGINFESCTAISSDGLSFAGYTTNGSFGVQGFVATILPPCPADLDNDGLFSNGPTRDRAVTIDDLLYFLTGFESGSTLIDLDNGSNTGTRDHAVTIDDLLYFLTHFEAGC